MKRIIFLILIFALCGCTKRIYIPVTTTVTEIEYRDRLQHDSIYFSDSVLIETKGDTVFNTKIKYRYINKIVKDTVNRTDSVYVEKPIEIVKYENRLNGWQKLRLNILNVLLIIAGGWLALKIVKLWIR